MEKNSSSQRLLSLDGIRGLAILLVLFSHLRINILDHTPNIFSQIVFDSGVIGVSLLFILSGFLMTYLYPSPSSTLSFLQKRYTRIFPLFVTVSTVMSIRIFNDSFLLSIFLLATLALSVHIIWVQVIKKFSPLKVRAVFLFFLSLQILVGLCYLFIVMRIPIVEFVSWTQGTPILILTGLINATLTQPVGTYIRVSDPVYWSLVDEVYFYILYPIICTPIIAFLKPFKLSLKILFLLTLLPLIAGISILSNKLLFLNLLHIHLLFYFVTGMTIGLIYHKYSINKEFTSTNFNKFIEQGSIFLFLGIIFASHLILNSISINIQPWIEMVFAIPFSFIILISLNQKSSLSKILNNKLLIFIGTISYSAYLIHIFVFSIVQYFIGNTTTLLYVPIYIFIPIIITLIVSFLLYNLLEKPYFSKNKHTQQITTNIAYNPSRNAHKILSSLLLIYVTIVFIVYQSDFSFLSLENRYDTSVITSPETNIQQQLISLEDIPKLTMSVTTNEDRLAIIKMDLVSSVIPDKIFAPKILVFRIKEALSDNWYYVNTYKIDKQEDDFPNAFAFPIIHDSKGKTFYIEMELAKSNSSKNLYLNTDNYTLKTEHFINKELFIANPLFTVNFLKSKLLTVLYNKEAQQLVYLLIPFSVISTYLLITKNSSKH